MPEDYFDQDQDRQACSLCGRSFPRKELVRGVAAREPIVNLIRQDHPDWSPESLICHPDLNHYRAEYVRRMVTSEEGEMEKLDQEVMTGLRRHEMSARQVEHDLEGKWTFGQRLADRMAAFVGTWRFLIVFMIFVIIWVGLNSAVILWHPADPYPFIFLNLILSCISAIQAPIILMSQNRAEAKDRLRSQHDYRVNLKAELEIRQLHEKIDHMISRQWERLAEIQEIQVELLADLSRAHSPPAEEPQRVHSGGS
jgi:uncharacterized membrane protein